MREYCRSLRERCGFQHVLSCVVLQPDKKGVKYFMVFGTNAMPTVHEGATQFMWHPSNERRAAAIISPAIKLIAAGSGQIPDLLTYPLQEMSG